MFDKDKIVLADALAAHLVHTLQSYYSADVPTDPRHDTGDAQTEPTYVMLMEIADGWLHVEMGVQGWADSLTFSVELPTLTRDSQT